MEKNLKNRKLGIQILRLEEGYGRVWFLLGVSFSDKVFREVSLRSWSFEEAGAFKKENPAETK